jgi:hypothetical protein
LLFELRGWCRRLIIEVSACDLGGHLMASA